MYFFSRETPLETPGFLNRGFNSKVNFTGPLGSGGQQNFKSESEIRVTP